MVNSIRLSSGVIPFQAIELPLPTHNYAIMGSIESNIVLAKKRTIIAQAIKEVPGEIDFTKKEIDQLYNLSIEYSCRNLNQKQLISEITQLRGGAFIDKLKALAIIGTIIILSQNEWIAAFQINPNIMLPPHMHWLYGNQPPQNTFGYNTGSEKKEPSFDPWSCKDIIRELNRQSDKRNIRIEVGNEVYSFKNPYRSKAQVTYSILAAIIYDDIRKCDTDICDIAQNLGFKADNIKNVKDHIFYNEHDRDRHMPPEHKRFDPSLEQGLAWKRLETGIHTQKDVTWMKHECLERHYELTYHSGDNEAHDYAQTHFDGYPWEN